MGTTLQVRRRADGSTEIVGDLPDEHELGPRSIARWLEMGLATVEIHLHPSEGDGASYTLTGFANTTAELTEREYEHKLAQVREQDPDAEEVPPQFDFMRWQVQKVSG